MDNTIMVDSRQILDEATAFRKQDRFDEAIELFEPIWLEGRESMSNWDCWNFALCLRKTGKVYEALDICVYVHEKNPNFKFNNDEYARCIYELEIKGNSPSKVAQDDSKFIDGVHKIVQLTKQDRYSPYERTVMAYLRYLNSKQNIPFAQVIAWTDKLDPRQLNDKSFTFQGEDGKQYELASYKESWYAYRTKALEKLGRYEECLSLSREAIEVLSKFHYGNDIWFQWRIGISLLHLEHISEAIAEFENVIKSKQDWFIQQSLAEAYYMTGDDERALQYAVNAALNRRDEEKKYKLFLLMADILERQEKVDLARQHVELAAAAYDNYDTNRIKSQLATAMQKYDIVEVPDTPSHRLYNNLKPFWQQTKFANLPQKTGSVQNLVGRGNVGFIRDDNGESHYFRVKSFLGSRRDLNRGTRVKFYVKPSYDPKKKKESTEAIHIIPLDSR